MIEEEVERINRERKFYGAAADYFEFTGLEALCDSGAGTGKSFSVMCKADYTARTYPLSRQLFARQTRKSMNDSILPDWRELVLFDGHTAISTTATKEHQDVYTYPNKATITLAGLENIDRILSAQYDRIYIFQAEETSIESWEKLISRLRNNRTPYHQISADVNPAGQFNWLNTRFADENLTDNRGRFLYKHHDNPLWFDHATEMWTKAGEVYIGEVLEALTGIRRERLLNHRWVAEEGVILDEYDPSIHLVSAEMEYSQGHGTWYLHVNGWDEPVRISYFTAGVDWGWEPDPGVLSVWAYDSPKWHPKIRRFRIAEVYRTKWQREEWAEVAEELWAKYGISYFSCDRSNPEAINLFNIRIGKHLGRDADAVAVKCPVIGGGHRSEISNGIDVMREGLRNKVTNHVRTFFVRDALLYGRDETLAKAGKPTCTEHEILSWVYQKNEEGKPNQEKPDKTCDEHGIDCWRYDEILNFIHGYGKTQEKAKVWPSNSYGAMFDRMLGRRKKKKKKHRYSWEK